MEITNLPNYKHIDISIGNTDFCILFQPTFHSYEEDWNSREHYHLFYECHFLKSGNICLTTEKENITINADDFFVVPKNLRHKIETISEPTRKISFYVTISQNKISGNNTYTWYKQIFTPDKPFVSSEISKSFRMLYELAKTSDSFDFIQESKMKYLFSLAFIELLQHAEELSIFGHSMISIDYDNELTLKIENFLIDNFLPNAQLEDLAQYLCLGTRQTYRLIKRLFGMSFQDIKNETRIRKAKLLIENKDCTLKEISETLGYGSYTGFYKSFRQATGITPEEYRDSLP